MHIERKTLGLDPAGLSHAQLSVTSAGVKEAQVPQLQTWMRKTELSVRGKNPHSMLHGDFKEKNSKSKGKILLSYLHGFPC